jgi:hypothetical protein
LIRNHYSWGNLRGSFDFLFATNNPKPTPFILKP